jgi:hypothetical protein
VEGLLQVSLLRWKPLLSGCLKLTVNLKAFIYPTKDGPRYHKGYTIVLGLLVFAWFMYVIDLLLFWWNTLIWIGLLSTSSIATRSTGTRPEANTAPTRDVEMTEIPILSWCYSSGFRPLRIRF